MTLIKTFKQLKKSDTEIAGGKGASLGELTQAGIAVPPGFVVLSQAFEEFLIVTGLITEIDAILDTVDHQKLHTVERASEKIHALILNAEIPKEIVLQIQKAWKNLGAKYVAVRSSATAEDSASAAWAGQLETYLNTTQTDLLKNVQRCWASLFSPRAIFYRFEKKLHAEKISVAVVVQAMVDSEKAGIAFSAHPVTQDFNQIIVEAAFGLGEAVVSGSITPDSYVIRKNDWRIVDKQMQLKSKGLYRVKSGGNEWKNLPEKKGKLSTLSDMEVKRLGKLVAKIEKHYGFPVDVEWAMAKDKLYVLQSRPITTLTQNTPQKAGEYSYQFSWGERHSVMTAEMWVTSYIRYRHIFANENQHVLLRVESGYVQTFTATEELPKAHQAGKEMLTQNFLSKYLAESEHVRLAFKKLLKKVRATRLTDASNSQLASFLRQYQELYEHVYALFKVTQPEYTHAAAEHLRSFLTQRLHGAKQVEQALITLTTPTEMDLIKKEELRSIELSLKKSPTNKDLLDFADEYPWFFFNTYDRRIIQQFLESKFAELQAIPTAERREMIDRAHSAIKKHKKEHSTLLLTLKAKKDIRHLASLFGALANDRLELKQWWAGGEYLFLSLFEEIAKRMGTSLHEFFMCHRLQEIYDALKNDKKITKSLMQSRQSLYICALEGNQSRFYEDKEASDLWKNVKRPESPVSHTESTTIKGTIANTGQATGIARIIRIEDLKELLKDMQRFQQGEIIVTTMTQPTMASLARKAAAIVTNEGGITSHAAILAREYGIPCIVGTGIATDIISDGSRIEVDANQGIVKVLE